MKILHICSYYIGSKLYKNLITNLDELGISNDVYIPVNSEELINKNYKEGLERTEFIYSKNFNKWDRLSFKLKTNKIYQDLLNKVDLENVDIVHAHSLFVNGYIAYRLKKEKNIDYIVAVRNTDVNVFFKCMPWMRSIGKEILKNAKKVIFISNPYRENVIQKYFSNDEKKDMKINSHVIPNGVDQFWIDNSNNDNVDSKDERNHYNIIYVGTIDKNKNIITTIKALDKLIEEGYNIKFDIIGQGPETKKIQKLIYQGRNYIEIHGYMEKEKLIHMYRKSDMFVMPSKKETFGLVYIEALTQGVPVIYTKRQGFDGYFEDGDVGFAVNHNDYIDISRKIKYALNKKWNLSRHKNDIEESFNWKTISEKYVDIYTS